MFRNDALQFLCDGVVHERGGVDAVDEDPVDLVFRDKPTRRRQEVEAGRLGRFAKRDEFRLERRG